MADSRTAGSGQTQDCGGACSSCGVAGCGSRTAGSPDGSSAGEPSKPGFDKLPTNGRSDVKKVIAVVSGKGGVGKSLACSLLASALARQGKRVAILDADVTGPSIPKAFGLKQRPVADQDGIIPIETESGIEVISVNLLLPEEDTPVAWRGPVVTGILNQFWGEVNWGDVDVMLIDMPPGTSDVFLTILQTLPIDGIVTVSAPQELVGMIVGKAVNLAGSMGVPVIGLVENMAYYECDGCGKRHHVFGDPQGDEVARRYGIEATAELPMDPSFARMVEAGDVEGIDATEMLRPILDAIERA